ncbi:MFS transporter [Streptomyces zhihengii]
MVASGVTAGVLLNKIGPRTLISAGLALAALGCLLLAQLDTGSGYVDGVLPGLVAAGLGAGVLFPTTFAAGTARVGPADAGAASALVNTAQQVGGSVGIALLSTFYAESLKETFASDPTVARLAADIEGYTTAFWWAAGLSLASAVIAFLVIRNPSRAEIEAAADRETAGVHVG